MKSLGRIPWMLLLRISAIIALAGCNGNGGSQGASASKSAPSESAEPAVRTYSQLYGDIEIPADPQRIVSLSYTGQLLTLGIQPIAVPQYTKDAYYLKDRLQNTEDTGSSSETWDYNIEKLLTLKPDLILTYDVDQGTYEQLSKVAPTAIVPWDLSTFEQLKQVAAIVGKEGEAQKWIDDFESKAKQAGEQIRGKIGEATVAAYMLTDKDFWVFGNRSIGAILYDELQLNAPAFIQKQIAAQGKAKVDAASISLEVLPDYAADYVFLITPAGGEEKAKEIMSSSLWKNVPAVQNNRIFTLLSEQAEVNDTLSMAGQLDEVLKQLAAPTP